MVQPEANQTVTAFFDYIWEDQKGYAYLAFKSPSGEWRQRFFQWPDQRTLVVKEVLSSFSDWNVYYGPALYEAETATKPNILGSKVVWVEIDGRLPAGFVGIPEPSMRIQTSSETHQHLYWKLTDPLKLDDLEYLNRTLTYLLNADVSGWDGTQVLRVPGTLNHKKQLPVFLHTYTDRVYEHSAFRDLPQPPPLTVVPDNVDNLPDYRDIIAKYPFNPKLWILFKDGVAPGGRSTGLMHLGHSCIELGMTDTEVMALLVNADARWGKFSTRPDRNRRLAEIVARSRAKHPIRITISNHEDLPLEPIELDVLLSEDVQIKWMWEHYLQQNGLFFITGPSGVGKTQVSLNAAANFALGTQFLNRKMTQCKVGFFSLEMGRPDLQVFLAKQMADYSKEELSTIKEYLRLYPLGEPLYMSNLKTRQRIEDAIIKEGLQGIMVDSFSSATENSLSDELGVKPILDWIDRLRQEYGIFVWMVHHHRKGTAENKTPNKLSDIYGSFLITARATTVITLWPTAAGDIDCLPLKVRLAPMGRKFTLRRGTNLRFTTVASDIVVTVDAPKLEPVKIGGVVLSSSL